MGKKKGGKGKKKHTSSSDEENEEENIAQEEDTIDEDVKQQVNDLTIEEEKKPLEAINAQSENKVEKSANYPVQVEYCKVCSLPIEYCEFSDRWVKCQEYLAQAFPDKLRELQELRENDKNKNKVINKKVAAEVKGEEQTGGKAKKKIEAELIVTITSRSKRKHVTTITGTEHFGIDANALAKILKKKFSSGASVVNKPELAIEIQGDFRNEIFEILNAEFKVPPENMYLVAEKKKTKYTEISGQV